MRVTSTSRAAMGHAPHFGQRSNSLSESIGMLSSRLPAHRSNSDGGNYVPEVCRRNRFFAMSRLADGAKWPPAADGSSRAGVKAAIQAALRSHVKWSGRWLERCASSPIDRSYPKYKERSMELSGKRIAILATNGFEQSELEVPRDSLKEAGATVEVVSLQAGEIKGWDKKDWGRPVKVDKTLDQVSAADYDAIILPGGQINPDLLRVEPKALQLIKDIFNAKKVVAAVCHAPWLLIETGIAKGRRMTSFKSIKTDVINAGANWEDAEVVVDQGVITSRNPGDLKAFSAKIIEEIKEGRHTQRTAA
jgi:protease I